MSSRLLPLRVLVLPAAASCSLAAASSRRTFALARPLAARSPPTGFAPRTTPSQDLPRLTLNLNGTASDGGDGMGARGHVGPFPVGVGMDSIYRKGAERPWTELSLGSKAARVGRNGASLLVVATGGLLFFIIAASVTSELFSPNSSTVIFGKATDLLKESEELKLYLIPPYTFHPPHASVPASRASNTRTLSLHSLPTSLGVDRATGRETHTFSFVVEGQREGDYRSPTGWLGRLKTRVAQGAEDVWDVARRGLEDAGVLDPPSHVELAKAHAEQAAAPAAASSSGSSWLGSLLRPDRASAKGKGRAAPPELGTFTAGDCVVRCEKNPDTHRLDVRSVALQFPSRHVPSTYTGRPVRLDVPVDVDDGASWTAWVAGLWAGEGDGSGEGKEAVPKSEGA